MANLVKHRFISPKTDGTDGTQIQPSHWNDGHAFTGGTPGDVLTRDVSDATFGASWGPGGHWVDVPYSAANFGATGGSWTVTAGNVLRFSYARIGKTLHLQVFIEGSTVGGNPSSLNLVTPFTIPIGQSGLVSWYVPPNFGVGVYKQLTQDPFLRFHRDQFATPFTAAAGATLYAALTIQIL